MVFRSAQRPVTFFPALTLEHNLIPACNLVTFLGIHLDPNLTFRSHFSHLKQKTAFGIRAIIKLRPFFPRSALLALYYAFVHSHLNYGIVSWGNTYICHLSSVQHIQNQSIRIITRSSNQSNAFSLLHRNNLLSISNLFYFNLGILFFKLLHNLLPHEVIHLNLIQNKNITRFATNQNFLLPLVHTNYGKKSSAFTAISFWNTLPSTVKSSSSVYRFKTLSRIFFWDKCIIDITSFLSVFLKRLFLQYAYYCIK